MGRLWMMNSSRGAMAKVVIVGAAAGFLGAWLLAIELAAIQGRRALQLGWMLTAPWDPEIQPFTRAVTLAAGFLSLVWYAREETRVQRHALSFRWYVKSVMWGLACIILSIALLLVPKIVGGIFQSVEFIRISPWTFLGYGLYGLAFGLPVVLVFSPIVLWIAEQAILRER